MDTLAANIGFWQGSGHSPHFPFFQQELNSNAAAFETFFEDEAAEKDILPDCSQSDDRGDNKHAEVDSSLNNVTSDAHLSTPVANRVELVQGSSVRHLDFFPLDGIMSGT